MLKIGTRFTIKGRNKTYSIIGIKGNDVSVKCEDKILNYQLRDIRRGVEITKNIDLI
jgi:SET domain-containing protein